MTRPVLAVILAGGEGRRMHGADKGLQHCGGRLLVEHVHAAIAPQVDAVVISANRNLQAYARIAPVVRDRTAGFAGPLAGIASALDRTANRWLATVPVDCPTPPANLVRRLADALTVDFNANCAVVFDGERVQPLFALYRNGLADAAHDALRDNAAPWQWQGDLGCVPVDFSDCRDAFRNLNSQADLDAFER